MKKRDIIKSSREYTEIINNCRYVKNAHFIIYYRQNEEKNRYGISVPTKTGKANVRNKIKRRVKNIIDINEITIQKNYDYVIIIRKGLLALSYQEIEISLLNLLKRLEQKMKNNKKILIITLCIFLLSGCTKTLKDEDNQVVKNEETGQSITENIICRPTNKDTIKIYEENDVDISKLPECDDFTPLSNYEGLWTSIFVKPLAWVIIKIGSIFNSYGLSLILTCLLIRCILFPITQKTAMQSELIKKAQPELDRLEKKYQGKDSQEDQTRKAQEMVMIYQKYKINPVSGCLLSFVQIPLLIAFYEAINRTPAIFEEKFLSVFEMGTTPWVGITVNHNYWYILLVVLILATTFFSFRKTLKDQSGQMAAGAQMKSTIYFMMAIIGFSSFTLPSALGIYWIASSTFTILQNMYVERKKVK